MGKKRRRRGKAAGRYCWACDRRRANERFSGRSQVCRDCATLSDDELAYRQALRDLERCVLPGGFVPRKRRKAFVACLEHQDPRVRAAAKELQACGVGPPYAPDEELRSRRAPDERPADGGQGATPELEVWEQVPFLDDGWTPDVDPFRFW